MRKYWFNIILPSIIVIVFTGSWLVMNNKISLKMLSSSEIKSHSAWDIDVQEQFAYLAEGKDGMSVYDISNPAEPELCALISTKDFASNIFLHEQYAYIGDGGAGVTIIDIKIHEIRKWFVRFLPREEQEILLLKIIFYILQMEDEYRSSRLRISFT